MGSFGMNWNHKASAVLWDWENSPPIGENPRMMVAAPQAEAKFAGLESTRHGSVHSSCGTFSSSSEMGYASSKSSVSASTDSSPNTKGKSMELSFAPVKLPDKNTGSGKVVAISSGEPVLSLKLGKRTYFEDVCGGQSVKSLPSAVTPPPPAAASAKKTKPAPNTQKTCCQVEGCKVDLSSAKQYHRKHRVCEPHSKAPKVVVAGLERRFCQQCSRFHGLAEFDQKKKSCRRRLNDHNARRRKPQPEALSFGSSRLSAMFYDTSLLFGQGPYGQMRSCASSSWDNAGGGFKFAETKAPWLRVAGVDELHLSSQQAWNDFMPHGVHQNFDGFTAFKETSAKVLDQGVEASAVVSNPNGDLQRAHSLLSSSPAAAGAGTGTGTNHPPPTAQLHLRHHHVAPSTLAAGSISVTQASSSPELWQAAGGGGAALGHHAHARFQALDAPGAAAAAAAVATTAQELLSYDGSSSSHYHLMR